MASNSTLNLYHTKLRKRKIPIQCKTCGAPVLPKQYETHCSLLHGFDHKAGCVWCGARSWNPGEKHQNARHLLECSAAFVRSRRALRTAPAAAKNPPAAETPSAQRPAPRRPPRLGPEQEPDPTPDAARLLDTEHAWEQGVLYGQERLPVPGNGPLWPLDDHDMQPPPVPYRDENLNLAARCCLHYLRTRDTHDWLHVMVKATAMESFARALDEEHGLVRTLKFSCWCDGGREEEAEFRQHRHLILAAPKGGHFEDAFWPKVRAGARPSRNFSCKKFQRISTYAHLVNTLLYASNRKSQCRSTSGQQLNHFYLYLTLPRDAALPLALMSEDGLATLMYQQKFQNVSVPEIAARPMLRVGRQWKQKIGDFYKLERGLVVPVSKSYAPARNPSPHFLHLLNGRKLYFEHSSENERLSDAEWLSKQVMGGNAFYDCVERELWTPRQRDQAILNYYLSLLQENKRLKTEKSENRRRIDELTREAEELKSGKDAAV